MAQRLTFLPIYLLSTAIALIRRGTIDEWAEQRLKHILLMLYLKDNNFTAATDIINKVCGLLCSNLGPEPTLPCFPHCPVSAFVCPVTVKSETYRKIIKFDD